MRCILVACGGGQRSPGEVAKICKLGISFVRLVAPVSTEKIDFNYAQ